MWVLQLGVWITKNYKLASKHFPSNTAHSCHTERHFIGKDKGAQLVQVLGIKITQNFISI